MIDNRLPYFTKLAIYIPYLLLNKNPDTKILPEQWPKIYKLLLLHGLIPFFVEFDGLKHHNPISNYKDLLVKQAKNITASNLKKKFIQKELENIFNKHDIPFIFLKGLNLSSFIYENPTIRPILDIDILIKKEHEKEIRNLLTSLGATETSGLQNKFMQQLIIHGKPLFYKDVLLELHTHIVPIKESKNFLNINLWENIFDYRVNDVTFKIFNPGFYLFYLCYHAHRHMLAGKIKLLWYIDIACLITKLNKTDINQTRNLAIKTNTTSEIEETFFIIKKFLMLPMNITNSDTPFKKPDKLILKFRTLINYPFDKQSLKTYYFKTWTKLTIREKIIYILSILFPSPSYIQTRFKIKSRMIASLFLIINPFRVLLKIISNLFRFKNQN